MIFAAYLSQDHAVHRFDKYGCEHDYAPMGKLFQKAITAQIVRYHYDKTEVCQGRDNWSDNVPSTCLFQDPDMPLWLSDHAQDFLSKTMFKDPSRRSAAAQLLKHPWLKSLGFRPPVDQVPSSVEVVEPVLPPRPAPAPQPEIEALVITQPVVEEETIKAVVPEAEAPSTGTWQATA